MRAWGVASGFAALAGIGLACARIEPPTGGPRDLTPPYIIAVEPDTFAIVDAGNRTIRFEFSERISKNAFGGGPLDQVVQVSPETGAVRVKHGRSSLEVQIEGGLQPDRVYRITVTPTVQDMFGNALRNPFELIVSTGPEFQPTVLAAVVTDWMTGEVVDRAVIEARVEANLTDTVPYLAVTDSQGIAIFRYLPPAAYELAAYEDFNRNRRPDYAEPQARSSALVAPADTLLRALELLTPDTIPARLQRVDIVDTVTLRLSFDDFLDREIDFSAVGFTLEQEGGVQWAVRGSLSEEQWAESQRDTSEVEPPTPPDSVEAEPPPKGNATGLVRSFVVLLTNLLRPGEDYTLTVSGVSNIHGLPDGGGTFTFTVPDTTGVSWVPAPETARPGRRPAAPRDRGARAGNPAEREGYSPCSEVVPQGGRPSASNGRNQCRSH